MKFSVLLFFIIPSVVLYGQKSPFSALHSQLSIEHKVWMPEAVPNGHNSIEARAGLDRGKWMAAQDAGQVRSLRLTTEGKADRGNLSLWGRFGYGHTMEDSTRLRHQTRINPDAPVYFGSLMNNYYERDVYKIDAVAQYRFLGGRLPLTLGLDYRVGSHFSNNDPRARLADFQFNSSLALGRNFPAWSIHLKGMYGYGRERLGIGYKDEKRAVNTSDTLYINWYMSGYGYVRERLTYMRYNDDFERQGLSLHLAQNFGPRNRLYLNAGFTDERQIFKLYDNSPLGYEPMNRYDRKNYRIDLLWDAQRDGERRTTYRLAADITDGRDFNHDIGRNNYVHRRESATAQAVSQINGSTRLEAQLAYVATATEDGAAGIRMDYSRLEPMLAVSRKFPAGKERWLVPMLSLGYNAALDHALTKPATNMGVFAEAIIGHDYLYHSTSSRHIGLGLDYEIRRGPRTNLTFGFRTDYSQRGGLAKEPSPSANFPGKDRLASEAYVRLFF